jgi:hypothetical protein
LCEVAEAEVVGVPRPATSLFPLLVVGGRCTANGALLPADLELFTAPALAAGAVPADLAPFTLPALGVLVAELAPIAGALPRAIMVGGVARVTEPRFIAEAGGTALLLGCCPPSIELRVGVRLTLRVSGACIRAERGTTCPAWFIARPLAIALPGAAVTAPFTVLFA